MRLSDKDDQGNTRQITSQALFKGAKVITILHNNQRYSIRITRQNKLILSK